MYYTMLEVIQGNVQEALVKGLETLSIAGVLALGILVVSTGTQFYLRTKKRWKPIALTITFITCKESLHLL